MDIQEGWTPISDKEVLHIWQGKDLDENTIMTYVSPDWYEKNGTPVDEYGEDMEYIKTIIKKQM